MPHKRKAGQVSRDEKREYAERLKRHCLRFSDYDKIFQRPPTELTKQAWKAIYEWFPLEIQYKNKPISVADFSDSEKIAMVVLTDLFIHTARGRRSITYNDVFDEVCRKFSDHFVASPANHARDMTPETVKNARRDLLINGIHIDKLWAAFRALQVIPGKSEIAAATISLLLNPIQGLQGLARGFSGTRATPEIPAPQVAHTPAPRPVRPVLITSQKPTKDPSTRLWVHVVTGEALQAFTKIVAQQPQYFSSIHRGVRLRIVGEERRGDNNEEPNLESLESNFCAEVAYNVVKLGDASIKSIREQSQVTLVFNIDAFNEDYVRARNEELRQLSTIRQRFVIDPLLASKKKTQWTKTPRGWVRREIWSPRDRWLYYMSILEGFNLNWKSEDILAELQKQTTRLISNKAKKEDDLRWKRRYEGFLTWLGEAAELAKDESIFHGSVWQRWRPRLHNFVRNYANIILQTCQDKYDQVRKQPGSGLPEAEERGAGNENDDASATERRALWLQKAEARIESLRAIVGTGTAPPQNPVCTQDAGLVVNDVRRASIAGRDWRLEVRAALATYDKVQDFLRLYRSTAEQVGRRTGRVLIRSRFSRETNRRYQPLDMWPTYVGDWSLFGESSETWYRKRWFSTRAPETALPEPDAAIDAGSPFPAVALPRPELLDTCPLVGLDVSSSQTQIVAVLFGIRELENLTMDTGDPSQVAFKQQLAAWAFGKPAGLHEQFELKKPRGGSQIPAYAGAHDNRLQELCKALWMKISYGSSVSVVVEEQNSEPDRFGPGWTRQNAQWFIDFLYQKFPDMQIFLQACQYIGETVAEKTPCEGVVFIDPCDRSEVRWNPPIREDYRLKSDGHTIILSLPKCLANPDGCATKTSMNFKNGDPTVRYPVDKVELSKMISPCLIHMLDAFYSTLVMGEIHKQRVSDFVGIHDCWLVPEKIRQGTDLCDGRQILRDILSVAARKWYSGLGPIYDRLIYYLGKHETYGPWIRKAACQWQRRDAEGYTPQFLVKPDVVTPSVATWGH